MSPISKPSKLIILSILISFFTVTLQANVKTPAQTREACQKLIDEAQKDEDNNHYDRALEKFLEAELIAAQHQWNDMLWDIKNQIGRIYYYTSGFGDALSYFQQSIATIENDKTLSAKATYPLNSIAILYAQEGKNNDALRYYKKAYEIVKNESGSWRKLVGSNMADAYIKIGEVEKGLELLNKVKNDKGTNISNFIWQAIYIEALIANNQIVEAQKIAEPVYAELISNSKKGSEAHCFVCIAGLLSKIYDKSNQIDKALVPVKKALLYTEKLSDHVDAYEIISRLYLQKGEYRTALSYKDSAFMAKDSLTASINRSQYEMNKVRFKTQEYQNELRSEKERKRAQQKIFFGAAILSLVVFFSIYRGLTNRIVKQRQKAAISLLELEKEKKEHQLAEKQKLLTEKELEMTKLKQEQLKHEITKRNGELTAKALYISNRNELIQGIVSSLEDSPKAIENKAVASQITIMKDILKSDKQHYDFINHFESVNPIFIKRLKEKHPKLTSNDVRFLCYAFINLSLKEISIIFNITYDASVFRKQRIIKKMGFDKKKISLYDYLISINN